ncbi:MAG: DUF6477 family protein [Pseudomonadota bacterium]
MTPMPNPAHATPVPAPAASRPRAAPEEPAPLRRPAPLVRAARAGAALYRRERHLRGIAPAHASPRRRARDVAARLEAIEADCEAARRAGRPEYAATRHVLVLSALLAERAMIACARD